MHVLDPYRTSVPSATETAPCHACPLCRLRGALLRVRLRTVVVAALAMAFLAVNGATAVVAFASMRLSQQMLALASAVAREPARVSPPSTQASQPAVECTAPGIERLTATSFNVAPWVVERTLEEIAGHMHATRIVPGDDAWDRRIVDVTEGSWLDRLGFRNGDVLLGVNRLDVSTPQQALAVYAQLRAAHDFTVDVGRAGMLRTVSYHVR